MQCTFSDEELVTAFLNGDEAAFDGLFQRYKDGIFRSAFLIVGNSCDSENVLQDTFIKAWQNLTGLREPAHFKQWLWRIMVRTAWAYCRKRHKEQPMEDMPSQIAVGESSLDGLLRDEGYRELWLAVNSLEVKLRTVIILYYYDEMSVKEIAAATGTLAGTVKSRLWTARRKLKDKLERVGEF